MRQGRRARRSRFSTRPQPRHAQSRSLHVEPLEPRQMLSGVSPLAALMSATGNSTPEVYAGDDQQLDFAQPAWLDASVTIKTGNPKSLVTAWSKVSGAGEVTFGDAAAIDTTAQFSDPGTYVLRLEASQAGRISSDDVTVTVVEVLPPEPAAPIVLEAESAALTAPMATRAHAGALGGAYVATDTSQQGTVRFDFDVEQAGDYVIWARVLAPSANQDSFFVSVDGGTEDVFDVAEGTWSSQWQWSAVNGRGETAQPLALNPRVFALSPGHHTITFRGREAGAGLDRIVITQEADSVPNQAPTVEAGMDQRILLSAALTLAGVVADDGLPTAPGALTTAWSAVSGPGGVTFDNASAINTSAHFSQPGTYVLRLEANDGALVGSDELTVTVDALPPAPTGPISLEAESGTLTVPMARRSHSGATGGEYVSTSTSQQGTVRFDFDVEQAGDYVIWARMLAPSADQDSFFVSVDGGAEDIFDAAEGKWSSQWQWSAVNGRGGTAQPLALNPRIFTLSPGHHTVTFRGREAGAGLDRIVISSDRTFAPNQAPVVDAGPSQTVLITAAATLHGTVADDGLPANPGSVTTRWSKLSGPGDVTFADASASDTTARFGVPGAYVLQLTADDGELTSQASVTLTVTETPQSLGGFYVSPSGSSSGDGSINKPWDLKTAMSQPAAVRAGDTIWLRGGTYRGGFTSLLKGTAASPITVRPYPGEHVRIDLHNSASGSDGDVNIRGDYVEFRDLEIMSSKTGPRVASNDRGNFNDYGSYNKFINLVIHDIHNIGFWADGAGGEFYGTIIYNNGYETTSGGSHAIYAQNRDGTKVIRDNLIFNQFTYGIHIYGSKTSYLRGFDVEGNTVFNNGAALGQGYKRSYDIHIGGSSPADNVTVANNYTYQNGHDGVVRLGYPWGVDNRKLTLADNYFVSDLIFAKSWNPLTASGNTVVGDVSGTSSSGISTVGNPSGARVFVRPNEYEDGRANITVYNWDQRATVDVDLSSVLTAGAAYEIHHVYDLFGAPVASGTYTGAPIKIPMKAVTAPRPIGGEALNAPITLGPEFGVFLVTTKGAAPANLLAAGGVAAATQTGDALTYESARPVFDYALQRWAATGVDLAQLAALEQLQIEIKDMKGTKLAQATSQIVTLDADAAGFGWFVDNTPDRHEEYRDGESVLVAEATGPAAGRMDLLTVVLHELGHVLGHDHKDAQADSHLMAETLGTGIRKDIDPHALDWILSGNKSGDRD